MYEKDVIVTTKYGQMPSFVACPDAPGQYPGIIFYMDAPGIREELRYMTRRIAKQGYFAVLPDMYYRLGTLRFQRNLRPDGQAQHATAGGLGLQQAKLGVRLVIHWQLVERRAHAENGSQERSCRKQLVGLSRSTKTHVGTLRFAHPTRVTPLATSSGRARPRRPRWR